MADVPRKPTQAQKRRLEQIGRGQITRHGPSWIYGSYHSTGTATGGITYNMMCGLHDAGWIADEPHGQYYKLILTEAGRGALGVRVCGTCKGNGSMFGVRCERCEGTGHDRHDPWCVGGERDGICNCGAAGVPARDGGK